MANETYLKNKKNYSPKQLTKVIQEEYQRKFGLEVSITSEVDVDFVFLYLDIKGLIIPLSMEKKRIVLFETPKLPSVKGEITIAPTLKPFINTWV